MWGVCDGYLDGAPPDEYHVHAYAFDHPGLTTTKRVIEPDLDPPPLDLIIPAGGHLKVSIASAGERRLSVAAVAEDGTKEWLQPDVSDPETYYVTFTRCR